MITLECSDAIPWLRSNADSGGSIVTSLPDADEIGAPVPEWMVWFEDAARDCLQSVTQNGVAVFYQTDRKHEGELISKAGLLFKAAYKARLRDGRDYKLLWHKIVLRRGVGKTDLHRPGYTHLIAFGEGKAKPGKATPDIIEAGEMIYKNAMGMNAARAAVKVAALNSDFLVDPFCGRGTILKAAAEIELDGLGIDNDPAQIAEAKKHIGIT